MVFLWYTLTRYLKATQNTRVSIKRYEEENMSYRIETNSLVIGTTELEHACPSMGIRHGVFLPTEGYSKFKTLFDDYYKAESRLTGNPGEVRIPEIKILGEKIKELGLTLVSETHGVVLVENISIEDPTSELELKDEPLQITIIVKSSEVYEKVFGYSPP